MPRNRTRSPRGPPPPRKPIEAEEPNMPDEPRETEKIRKSDKEWMRQLTPEQFRVCRLKGTERPFTGKYDACKDKGTYVCACCGNPLFRSEAKFDSGTGWPSFFEPIAPGAVAEEEDRSEVHTSELQSLMSISYAVFCLKKKKQRE